MLIVCDTCDWTTDTATNEHAIYDAASHSYAADEGHHTICQPRPQGGTRG